MHGASATQQIVIDVYGSNDTPVITSSAQTGAITEAAGVTGSTALDTASGAVTFTDVDLTDTHTVTVTGVAATGVTSGLADNITVLGWLSLGTLSDATNGATGSDAWTFSAQDKSFDYLAAGETVTLNYAVQVADNQGGTTSQNVAVTITGSNDVPTITAGAGDSAGADLTEGNSGLTASGTLTVTDVDVTDAVTASVIGAVASGPDVGSLTTNDLMSYFSITPADPNAVIDATHTTGQLTWNFNSDPQAFDFLAAGEVLTLTYTVQPSDGHTQTDTGNGVVTINITGTNDAPESQHELYSTVHRQRQLRKPGGSG